MRVALIAGPYAAVPPKQYGGTEQVIHYLIKGLKEQGHTPILLGTGDSEVDCELLPITAKALHFAKTRQEEADRQTAIEAITRRTMAILTDIAYRVDVVHSHGFDLQEFTAKPSLTTLHNRSTLESMPYYMARRNQVYVSISKNQRKAYPGLNYIATVYNGEDPSLFPVVTKPDDYVCFLGRFDRDKNPHLAIELALALGVKIKLAGKVDFNGNDYFDQYVAKYFDHPLVEYLGELGFDDKVELISNAKCNFHPTGFREPFGLTVLEAAYCGTPTIAIARGALPEIVQHGRTGMLVEDFEEAYRLAGKCFALNRSHVARWSRRKFNYKKMARQYVTAYNALLLQSDIVKATQGLRRPSSIHVLPGKRMPA